MAEWIVRDATATDAEACSAIYAPYVETTTVSFEDIAPDAAEMLSRIADARAWLVLDDGTDLRGYAYAVHYSPRAAYRWTVETSVYLRPDARGTGSGRRLYQALLDQLVERGYRQALAGLTLPNPASERLHRALGFTPVGVLRQVGWKHGAWHDVARLQRVLAPVDDPPAEPR